MIGESAPNFTLKNTEKSDVSLSDYKGKTVILAFYPGAFTGVCENEMCTFQDNFSKLGKSNAAVIGISVDSPWANAEFASKYNLEFELLSDIDREVVEAYDAQFVGLGGIGHGDLRDKRRAVPADECLGDALLLNELALRGGAELVHVVAT